MQDEMIVALYWKRDEKAISETERKYGRYLSKIAYNILSDLEDSKERHWAASEAAKKQGVNGMCGSVHKNLL